MISSLSTHKLNQQGPNNNARRGGLQRLPSLANAGVADTSKHDVYLAVEKQAGLEFAMLKLTSTAFEQAAATDVIQWVLDKKLFRSFSLFIIACDMIFLILIIAVFTWSSSIFFSTRVEKVMSSSTLFLDDDFYVRNPEYDYVFFRVVNGKQVVNQMTICTVIIM
jgi:hypothetical protein